MVIENKATYLKHEVLTRIAKLCYSDELVENVDKIPLQMINRNSESFRCCLYKDRAIIKFRTIASLGFDLGEEEKIDSSMISEFAREISNREKPEFPILTFIEEACRACVQVNYFITNVCKNCVARPCMVNCPKDAIYMGDSQANIKAKNCINCGICQKVCPYHAIVYVPVPCEEACPVDAMYKDQEGKEHIDYTKCIYCGKCTKACPFGAIMEKSQIVDIIHRMKQGKEVIAMVAPSIIGQYKASIFQIASALKKIGFTKVVEVAIGAEKTAQIESEEFIERMEKGDKLLGTSCCPAYVATVRKHAPDFMPYVSDAKTPMAYTAEMVKNDFKDAVTVFIGPCVAKKHEGRKNEHVDYVLTYEEMHCMFQAKEIDPEIIEINENDKNGLLEYRDANNAGRGFPVTGGVAGAVKEYLKKMGIELNPVYIDGLTNKTVKLLTAYATRTCPGNLIEVMACEGGCMSGPGVIEKPEKAQKRLTDFMQQK
jgi:[FeFe] hydrogenase (group B1/B3)